MNAARRQIRALLCWCSVLASLGAVAPASAQQVQQGAPEVTVEASEAPSRRGVRRARGEARHKFAASPQRAQRDGAVAELPQSRHQPQSGREGATAPELTPPPRSLHTSEARSQEGQILGNRARAAPEPLKRRMPVNPPKQPSETLAPQPAAPAARVPVAAASFESAVIQSREEEPAGSGSSGTSATPAASDRGSGADVRSAGSWNIGKTLAVVAGTIGLAGTTWAVVHGVAFHNDKAKYERLQRTVSACSDPGAPCEKGSPRYQKALEAYAQSRALREDASRSLYRSVAGVMVAGSGFLAGAMLWFTVGQQHSAPRTAVRIQPLAGAPFSGISVSGSW